MFRGKATILATGLYIPLSYLPHLLASLISSDLAHLNVRLWGRFTMLCAGVSGEIEGLDNLPEGPAVYMANHTSFFDVFAVLALLPVQYRWIVKYELSEVFCFGTFMKRAGYIMVKRDDRQQALASMQQAYETLRSGRSIFIFPEGKRSAEGEIASFKKGGFYMAQQAGVPIVPVSIRGSATIHRKGTWDINPGHVTIQVHEPIESKGLETVELMEEVYKAIEFGYIGEKIAA